MPLNYDRADRLTQMLAQGGHAAETARSILKYDADEARDDHGRFAASEAANQASDKATRADEKSSKSNSDKDHAAAAEAHRAAAEAHAAAARANFQDPTTAAVHANAAQAHADKADDAYMRVKEDLGAHEKAANYASIGAVEAAQSVQHLKKVD